jgi:hypothetical protein
MIRYLHDRDWKNRLLRTSVRAAALFVLSLGWPASARIDATGVALLDDPQTSRDNPLPDYSYAGYAFGLRDPLLANAQIVDVRKYGAVPDDDIDDSRPLLKAFAAAHAVTGPVIVQLPPGRLIISDVLRIERGHFVLRGAGRGFGGSELFFPRPLKLVDRGNALDELRSYLVQNDKRQIEPDRNIDLPFSEYSWTGGFLWVQAPKTRPSPYLEKFDPPRRQHRLTEALSGRRGAITMRGPLLHEIYGNTELKIGEHHWMFPQRALVIQSSQVIATNDNVVTLADPLLHDIDASLSADIASWDHLSEVGIQDLALVFPDGPSFGHHLEQGYNGIYLTSVFNGWVRDVRIENADSGILTYNSASLTVADVVTQGQRTAHYSVHVGNVHNVLVSDLQVLNPVIHPLSVNTQSTRSVFLRAQVFERPGFDQHAGANHQNLFDNTTIYATARRDERGPWYPVWDGSGASYWQPGHGQFNTTWNLRVIVTGGASADETVRLVGADEGPDARIVGISGNRKFELDYRPAPYVENVNQPLRGVPSLYEYQLARRKSAAAARDDSK